MRTSPCISTLLAALLLVVVGTGVGRAASKIEGRVELREGGQALRSEEVRNAVVYFKPRSGMAVRPAAEVPEIVMLRKEFAPHVLAVTVGSTVRFPNSDPILHNVFSVSGGNAFDLGLYPQGPGKTATFHDPGLVRVFCNVHHDMVAYVLVLDTPCFVSPGADGRFELAGLPGTQGLLAVWHERTEPWAQEVSLPLEAPLLVTLDVTKPLVPPHPDKNGKPYTGATVEKSYR